jgi:hypothetical protein
MCPEIVAPSGQEKPKKLLQKRRYVRVNFRISDGRGEIRNMYLGNARAELDITFARLCVSILLNKLA